MANLFVFEYFSSLDGGEDEGRQGEGGEELGQQGGAPAAAADDDSESAASARATMPPPQRTTDLTQGGEETRPLKCSS